VRLIRSLIMLALICSLVVCGATVELGDRTFFGHVKRIWESEETQGLVEGVKEKSGPVLKRVKRGVEAATEDDATDNDTSNDTSDK
jgi:hypothetical protein